MRDENTGWFLTYTGKMFYPTEPHVDDICIEDIAHALSNICRFGGHTREHYSVAQHSVGVSRILPVEKKFKGLMHDATEAYVGDMVRPLKLQIPQYKQIEENLWNVICQKYGIDPSCDQEIKHADNVMLMTERRDLVVPHRIEWSMAKTHQPTDEKIDALRPCDAETLFLHYFKNLYV